MADSVIEPLKKKVSAINTNYESIVQRLSVGDPTATNDIRELVKSTKHIFADFKSAISHMKYGVRMSPGFYPNTGLIIAMTVYFIKEIIMAIQLFNELLKLASNIANLKTVMSWFYNDIVKAQQFLSLAKLHVERALNRTKQKIQKNVEWQKQAVLISVNEKYSKQKEEYCKDQLELVKKTQQLDARKPSQSLSTAEALAYNLQQEKNKQKQINQYAEAKLLENELKTITIEISSYDNQRKALLEDKRYWKKRWSEEEDQDKKFFSTVPKINAHMEA